MSEPLKKNWISKTHKCIDCHSELQVAGKTEHGHKLFWCHKCKILYTTYNNVLCKFQLEAPYLTVGEDLKKDDIVCVLNKVVYKVK